MEELPLIASDVPSSTSRGRLFTHEWQKLNLKPIEIGVDMVQVTKPERPIGYWLKRADTLLTQQIDKAQAANGVSRVEWQVLNMIGEAGSVSKERIFGTMLAFVDAPGVDEIVTRLVGRGWAEQTETSRPGTVEFQLTEEGRRRHSVILATQKEVIRQVMQGISEEEYATVIRVLKRLVSNLEGRKLQ